MNKTNVPSGLQIPEGATGLCLYKIVGKDTLVSCERVTFASMRDGVDTVLRRAAISGRVEVDGTLDRHFADVLNKDADIVATVALDKNSYRALKNQWMRCRIVRAA